MSPRILTRTPREPGVLAGSDKWRTPRALFDALNAEFCFAIDLAADAESTLCERWLGPGSPIAEDALVENWQVAAEAGHDWTGFNHLWGFLNPPYSSALIKAFMEDCVAEQTTDRFGVVALVPDTHDTQWYRGLAEAAEIRRIPHRVPYLTADGVTKAGAMFPSCVAIFRPQPGVRNPQPRVVEWTWRTQE